MTTWGIEFTSLRAPTRSGALALALLLVTPSAMAQRAPVTQGAPAAQRASEAPVQRSNMFRDPFFVEVEFGPSYVAMMAVRGDRSAFPNFVAFTGWGPSAGVTVGLHALVFSVGIQCYVTYFGGQGDVLLSGTSLGSSAPGNFHMVSTTLEGALRLPSEHVEFSLHLAAGHAFMGGFSSDATTGFPGVTANGWIVRGGIGVDFRVWRNLFVGLGTDVAVANVRRSGLAGSECPAGNPACVELQQDGDAIALLVHPHLQVGMHF